MFCSLRRLALLVVLVSSLAVIETLSCSRHPEVHFKRLAIPPFENLSGDASLEWMRSAGAKVVATCISSSRSIDALPAGSRRDAPLLRPTHILHGRFFKVGSLLRLDASVERLAGNRMERFLTAEGPASEGILPLASSIAKAIDPAARPFGTSREDALRAYAEAAYERAVEYDPSFGQAYASWAQTLLSRGDRVGAARVLERAAGRAQAFTDLDRARLLLVDATRRNDNPASVRALRSLAKLMPADTEVLGKLAGMETVLHEYGAAVDSYRKASVLDPENALLWNDLGYAHIFAGNFEAAREALREYQELAPDQANPLDSLGDAHFHFGHFAEAEKFYLEAHRKSPTFLSGGTLYKAARARLMTGDIAGADQLFRRFAGLRRAAKDPLAAYREAQWNYLAGRRREAASQLAGFVATASVAPDAISQACAQLSFWNLLDGNRRQARAYSEKAAAAAQSPSSRALAAMSRLLAEPFTSANDAELRARRAFPGDEGTRKLALAYALLLGGRFAEALPLLTELTAGMSPASPDQVNVLLAWAMIESGRAAEAAKFLRGYGLPQPGGEYTFVFLAFPRVFALRGAVLEKEGKREEARQAMEVFRKLSGAPASQSRPSSRS